MSHRRFALPAVTLAILTLFGRPAPAPAQPGDLTKLDASTKLVPADAAFYFTSLRLGEQMDRFLTSNAYAKLRALPAAKYAVDQLRQQAAQPDSPLGHVKKFFDNSANRELAEVLNDLWRREIFFYGGGNCRAQVLPLLSEVNRAQQFAPLTALLSGGDPTKAQARAILRVLEQSAGKLQVPELVVGFRLSKPDPAVKQIQRLEELLARAAANEPMLRERVKRTPVAGTDALTLSLDGSLVPWDKIPWDEFEEKEGEYKQLVAKLKSLTLTVSLLVKGDYLLLAVGPTTATAAAFGRGPTLADQPELRPLAKFADRPVVAVGYSSKPLAAAVTTTSEDLEGVFATAKTALGKAPIADDRRRRIAADLDKLAKEVAALLPKPGAALGFTFLTPRGQESYSYSYAPTDAGDGRPLTILDHTGGSPLAAVAGHVGDPTPGYWHLVQWVGVIFRHADGVALEMIGEEQHKQMRGGLDLVLPFLKRFDEITGNLLLPALGDGQAAFVLDAKWASKNWFPGLDQGGKELPLLELGCVRSVRDSGQVLKALQSYRELANDVLAKAREFGAPLPEGGLPGPEAKKAGAGTLYYWPIPPHGQDERLQPNLGLSERAVVVSLSLSHSERLLTPTPLKTDGGPLTRRGPLLGAAVVDIAGLLGAVRPWVEQLALPAALRDVPDDAPKGLTRAEIPEQVRTVLDVLQRLRGYSSVTYREGDATVTHGETVIRDLK